MVRWKLLSVVSNRMNEIMKVLTIFSAIMLRNFHRGVYGMNFDNMPELHSHFSYYTVWGIIDRGRGGNAISLLAGQLDRAR